MNPPIPPQIDWSQATDIKCTCGHTLFTEVYMVKRFSRILTGTPEDKIVPVACLKCESCGKINDELLPPVLRPSKPVIENQ